MKNQLLAIILVFVGSVFYTPASAQSLPVYAIEKAVKKKGKYAILVPNANYFKAAVMTGKALKSQNPKLDFEIVLISAAVKDLAVDESLIPFIETSKKEGIRIVICEFAMNHFEVNRADYHNSIETTPDGFIYMFGLQESGFKTISL